MSDSMADGADQDGETVAYQFEMAESAWRAWVDTIPRSQPIHARLTTLIEQDYRTAMHDDENGEELNDKTMGVFATRIRIRAMQAIGALRDDDDPDEAIEQLEEIMDMADLLEG
jgi:predicted RNase H-like HicB family nuclease